MLSIGNGVWGKPGVLDGPQHHARDSLVVLSYWHAGLDVDDFSLFNQLILLRLTSLDMRDGSGETLFRMHENSSFALENLNLTFFPSPSPASCADELLVFLTYNREQSVRPHLEHLVVCERECRFSEKVMLRMVESRWRTTPLELLRSGTGRRTGVQPSVRAAHRAVLNRIAELTAYSTRLFFLAIGFFRVPLVPG
ncbi:hypothetical protein FB451DRAFT_1411119 [Mycena latifolia]|nr:hypothetical protein FB451DRAFT_1411119 [Mycena latifolia]